VQGASNDVRLTGQGLTTASAAQQSLSGLAVTLDLVSRSPALPEPVRARYAEELATFRRAQQSFTSAGPGGTQAMLDALAALQAADAELCAPPGQTS
jgi:hypothetical protein